MKTHRIPTLFALIAALFVVSGCAVETTDTESVAQAIYDLRRPGRVEILRGNNGKHYFHLKAGNGQIILQSQGYVAKAGAENGVESVKTNAIDLANYDLHEAKNGEWYFNLIAQNGQVIGTSETYVTKYNATRGMETVQRVTAKVLRYEAALNGGAGFELFEGKDGQLYFHLEAANHEIVLQSEGYASEAGARNGIDSVRDNGRVIDNYEILPASNG